MLVRDKFNDSSECKTAVIMIQKLISSSWCVQLRSAEQETCLNAWWRWTHLIWWFFFNTQGSFPAASCLCIYSHCFTFYHGPQPPPFPFCHISLPLTLSPYLPLHPSIHPSLSCSIQFRSEVTDVAALTCRVQSWPLLASQPHDTTLLSHTALCVCVWVCERQTQTECQEMYVGMQKMEKS